MKGKDFEIKYEECGDEEYYQKFMLEDSEGNRNISNYFEIKAKGDSLKKINSYFKTKFLRES